MTATTTPQTTEYSESGHLYMSVELSRARWRLALSRGGEKVRRVWVEAGDHDALLRQLEAAKKDFELPAEAGVRSCYEAGRDGFWVHRLFTQLGIENLVIDAASMKVSRRRRRAKNDRLDADQLLVDLVRHHRGDPDVWKVVRVPPPKAEDLRRVPRQLERLKKERRQHRGRLLSLFATVGAGVTPNALTRTLRDLDAVRCWDGRELAPCLRLEIEHEAERLAVVSRQIRKLEAMEKELASWDHPEGQKVHRLLQLRGVGLDSACLLVFELFGWREFSNRKQVGSIAGMCSTPYNTGDSEREQGISKAGLARVRTRTFEATTTLTQGAGDARLQILLERRELEPVRRRLAHVATLPLLARDQTQAYLSHRLQLAGAKPKIFLDEAADAVFEITRGNLRAIDHLCFKALELAARDQRHDVSANLVANARRLLML